jgi:hypothetical protein
MEVSVFPVPTHVQGEALSMAPGESLSSGALKVSSKSAAWGAGFLLLSSSRDNPSRDGSRPWALSGTPHGGFLDDH